MTTAKKTAAKKPATDKFTKKYVDEVRAAETAAQRSVVTFPDGDTPTELTEALDLRVEVNLRQADGKTVTRVGGADKKVRALEAPYSKRKAPASA